MREGKPLMRQVSGIPRLNKQNSIKKRRKKHKNGEREKAFVKVQKKKSMINLSILDTAAYCINEDNWLKEATVGPEYCYSIFSVL